MLRRRSCLSPLTLSWLRCSSWSRRASASPTSWWQQTRGGCSRCSVRSSSPVSSSSCGPTIPSRGCSAWTTSTQRRVAGRSSWLTCSCSASTRRTSAGRTRSSTTVAMPSSTARAASRTAAGSWHSPSRPCSRRPSWPPTPGSSSASPSRGPRRCAPTRPWSSASGPGTRGRTSSSSWRRRAFSRTASPRPAGARGTDRRRPCLLLAVRTRALSAVTRKVLSGRGCLQSLKP
mmetsp:Transcript_54829/g.172074  ORF Transcript_54829/g.172074 Transcript_54829/m.172074 type:complete len:232 (+) Transcript_54829:310-1005(+)